MVDSEEISDFEGVPDAGGRRSKRLTVTILVIFGTFLFIGGTLLGLRAYLDRPKVKVGDKAQDTSDQKPPEQTSESQKSTVPANFKKVVLNAVVVSFPENWGEPKEKQETQEKIAAESDAVKIGNFQGAYARWLVTDDKSNDWIITVNNKDSYVKDLSFNGEWPTKEAMAYLEKVYGDKKINPEEIYNLPQSAFLPPQFSSYVNAYNPRYVESSGGKWRGFWYISGTGNGTIANLGFRALLFNKTSGKVVSISGGIESANYDTLWKGKEANDKLRSDIDKYFQTAYIKDLEVNKKVDDEYLKVIKYLQ